jgi:hypothetical protein
MTYPSSINSFLHQLHKVHSEKNIWYLCNIEEASEYDLLARHNDILHTTTLGIAAEFSKVEDMIDGFNKGSSTSLYRLKERHLVRIEGSICK